MVADIERVLAVMDALGVARGPIRGEAENDGYAAAVCETADGVVRFRVARVTPTKTGSFVAVWRRAADGTTEPFGAGEQRRLVIVTRDDGGFGAFVFPDVALAAQGVVSVGGVGGKRGFRVY